MPNMFGGSQYHPAYDPRWKATEDEDCLDGVLYTVRKYHDQWCVVAEDVTGRTWIVDPPTEKLRKRLAQMQAA